MWVGEVWSVFINILDDQLNSMQRGYRHEWLKFLTRLQTERNDCLKDVVVVVYRRTFVFFEVLSICYCSPN